PLHLCYLTGDVHSEMYTLSLHDALPIWGVNIDNLIGWLNGSYGLHYTGAGLTGEDPDGDGLRFIPTSDKYREMLEYIHKLFDEEDRKSTRLNFSHVSISYAVFCLKKKIQ